MTQDELVLKVSRLYEEKWGLSDTWLARAAIAIIRGETLEEAARECGLSSVGLHFAAAIRALKEGK